MKPVSNLKLRLIIQVFGLSAPQTIYTSSAEYLFLLRAVPRRNTRGLCSQGTPCQAFSQKGVLGRPWNEKWTPLDAQILGGKREIIFNYFPKYINLSETK
jgi:hypothetical protein